MFLGVVSSKLRIIGEYFYKASAISDLTKAEVISDLGKTISETVKKAGVSFDNISIRGNESIEKFIIIGRGMTGSSGKSSGRPTE